MPDTGLWSVSASSSPQSHNQHADVISDTSLSPIPSPTLFMLATKYFHISPVLFISTPDTKLLWSKLPSSLTSTINHLLVCLLPSTMDPRTPCCCQSDHPAKKPFLTSLSWWNLSLYVLTVICLYVNATVTVEILKLTL